MSLRTINVVDNTTDTITVPAHGLTTGDGPIAIYTATGVIPTGLAPVTDYYAIVTGVNTFKLATSSALALAGTPVDITSNGTLPLFTAQFLPYRRPATYAAGSQVQSIHINSIFDTLVGLWNLLTGQAQAIWNLVTLAVSLVVNGSLTVTGLFQHEQIWQHSIGLALPDASASLSVGVAGTTATRLSLLTSTGDNILGLAIPVGTITKWSVTLNKASAGGTITARCYECNTASGAGVTQVGATQTNAAASPGAIALGQTGLAFVMTPGREYFIVVNGGGTTGDQATSYYAAVTGT